MASSDIDVIEAFTPAPDCDLSFKDARKAWKEKVLWINFPSSVHLYSSGVIQERTRRLLAKSCPGDRFILGIAENISTVHRSRSLNVIADTINELGTHPIEKSL